MKTTQCSEAAELEDGLPVLQIEGVLQNVYTRTSGGEGEKRWTKQDCVLQDDSGTAKVVVWNHDDLQRLTGQKVRISAVKGTKGGFKGLFSYTNEWKGKTTKGFKVTDLGKVESVNGASSEPQSPPARQESQGVSGQRGEAASDSGNGLKAARQAAWQATEAFKIALGAASAIKTEFELGTPSGLKNTPPNRKLSEDQFQAITSSIFIFLDRHGLVDKLPKAPAKKEAPKESPRLDVFDKPDWPDESSYAQQPYVQPPPQSAEDDEVPF